MGNTSLKGIDQGNNNITLGGGGGRSFGALNNRLRAVHIFPLEFVEPRKDIAN